MVSVEMPALGRVAEVSTSRTSKVHSQIVFDTPEAIPVLYQSIMREICY